MDVARHSLRIAHVTATFPPYQGGTGNVCYHNTRVLAARGHDVTVYTAATPGEPDDPPGVTVRRLRPLLRVGNAPVLPQLSLVRGMSLVHLHYPFYAGAEFVALTGQPYVITYHQDVQIPGLLGWVARVHDRTIGHAVLRRASRFCPTTLDYLDHSVIAKQAERMADRVIAVPNGVDIQRFSPGPVDLAAREQLGLAGESPVALFVGAMDRAHYFKGVPTLLRALADIPGVSLVLVGDGDLRPKYQEIARDLGLASRAVFTGRISADQLPTVYRAADVLVLPSETRGEAFGMVLLEAMASGRPVIATDLPGVRSVVTHGVDGLLVPPSDATQLGKAIEAIAFMTPDARTAMGAAGRLKVERSYAWERIGERLEQIYFGVLDGAGTAGPLQNESE